MFEVGKDYTFHILDDSSGKAGVGTTVWTVQEVNDTLLKLSNKYAGETILNTASLYFVQAVPVER